MRPPQIESHSLSTVISLRSQEWCAQGSARPCTPTPRRIRANRGAPRVKPTTNAEVAKFLREMALFLDMAGVAFKPRASDKAAYAVEARDRPVAGTGLTSVGGLGPKQVFVRVGDPAQRTTNQRSLRVRSPPNRDLPHFG